MFQEYFCADQNQHGSTNKLAAPAHIAAGMVTKGNTNN